MKHLSISIFLGLLAIAFSIFYSSQNLSPSIDRDSELQNNLIGRVVHIKVREKNLQVVSEYPGANSINIFLQNDIEGDLAYIDSKKIIVNKGTHSYLIMRSDIESFYFKTPNTLLTKKKENKSQ